MYIIYTINKTWKYKHATSYYSKGEPREDVICWNCGKNGHLVCECKEPRNQVGNSGRIPADSGRFRQIPVPAPFFLQFWFQLRARIWRQFHFLYKSIQKNEKKSADLLGIPGKYKKI